MLNRLIALVLRRRLAVVVAALAAAVWGTVESLRMPVDVLPDLDRPVVTVLVEAHGLPSTDVERRVARPIEARLRGLPGLARLRSISGRGFFVVYAEFDWSTDQAANRRRVEEKLAQAKAELPPGLKVELTPEASIMGQVQFVGLESGSRSPTELRALADAKVLPRLRALPGVAQVLAIGGASREMQVEVEAARLREHSVTLTDVEDALRATPGPEVASAPLPGGKRVGDVARVATAPSPVRLGEAGVNGKPGVVLILFKQPGVDTLDLTRRVDLEVAALRNGLDAPDVRLVTDIFRQSDFIERSVRNVETALRDGALLVVVVLFLFLANFRTTVITLSAIPLSIALTAIVFKLCGLTINTMTLGGLAVAIGALVDDAVVDVENVFRRLRQNSAAGNPSPALWIVFRASCEVRNPIFIGTLLVVVVYIPLFFLSGMEGRLFTPIGIAYIVSTLASLAVSLTVTPVLCHYLLRGPWLEKRIADPWLVKSLKPAAAVLIRFGMSHGLAVASVLVSLTMVSAVFLGTRGTQFLPAFNEGSVQVNLMLPPGATLEASEVYAKRLDEILAGVRGVKTVGRRTGRADGDTHVDGPSVTEAIATLDPDSGRTREEIVEEIRARVTEELPGPGVSVEQPLAHLLSHLLSGVNAQVAVKVYGPDLEVLRKTAGEIEAALRPVAGVRDLFVEPQVLVEDIEATPNPARCIDAGISEDRVRETVEMALAGEELGRARDGDTTIPLVLRLRAEDGRDLDTVRDLPIRAADGTLLRVRDVATVGPVKSPNMIFHEDGARRAVVQHNVAGRPLGDVVADVERALGPVRERLANLPGYSLRVSGQFEAQQSASRRIALFSVVALAALAFILLAHFRSANLALQALLSLPAAFVGAAAAVAVTGQSISVATLVGLISLGGIATRNAILLLDHYLHLAREEAVPFGRDLIIRAGQERMVPVLMTALCSGIALVPLVLDPDRPGRELLYPVATVILGGLATVTFMEFLLTPGIFWLFGQHPLERHTAGSRESEEALARFREKLTGTARDGAKIPSQGDVS
ncbi:MAG: efflux RND transporter permease subunit [Planctomycetota bacterium]